MTLINRHFHAALAGLTLVTVLAGAAVAQPEGQAPAPAGAPLRLDGYGVTTGISGSRAQAIMDLQNGTGPGRAHVTGPESSVMWDNYLKSIGKGGAGAPLKTTVTEGVDSGR